MKTMFLRAKKSCFPLRKWSRRVALQLGRLDKNLRKTFAKERKIQTDDLIFGDKYKTSKDKFFLWYQKQPSYIGYNLSICSDSSSDNLDFIHQRDR